MPVGCAAFFDVSFSVAIVFLCWFSQFTDAFLGGRFVPFLLYIICISAKSQTVLWAQNFRDVQLITNF